MKDFLINWKSLDCTDSRKWVICSPTLQLKKRFKSLALQSDLCTTTNLGIPNLWPLLTGGRCSEVALSYKNWKWDPKMVVAVGKWSIFGGR